MTGDYIIAMLSFCLLSAMIDDRKRMVKAVPSYRFLNWNRSPVGVFFLHQGNALMALCITAFSMEPRHLKTTARITVINKTLWWRHGMETLSVLLALCEGNPMAPAFNEICTHALWCNHSLNIPNAAIIHSRYQNIWSWISSDSLLLPE